MTPLRSVAVKPGVYFAQVDGEGVLLDLAANRYVGLTALSAGIWRALSGGAAEPELAAAVERSTGTGAAPEVVREQLRLWLEAGLILNGADGAASQGGNGLPACRPPAPGATAEIDPAWIDAAPLSPASLLRAFRAHFWVRRALARQGLSWTLAHLGEAPNAVPFTAEPADAAWREIRAARALRTFFLQGAEDCLPRSLALARMLRSRGVDAAVCFGVRKLPFAAHAWVEAGGMVLSERLATIQGYAVLARF